MAVVEINSSGLSFSCNKDDQLLRAALRAGVAIPYECNSGGCGSCKVRLVEGEVENLYPDAPGQSARDKRKNIVLACQCCPKSESLVIDYRQDEQESKLPVPVRFSAILASKIDIADDLIEFAFDIDKAINYLPGQFFMLSIPGVGERAYSNSSISVVGGQIKFIIKKMPGGRGSSFLFSQAEVGQPFEMDGPFGHSYLRLQTGRDIALIAGGSGLSPMISMLRALGAEQGFHQHVDFYYGAKLPGELNEEYILNGASSLNGSFSLTVSMSGADEEISEWQGERGFIHEVVDRKHTDYRNTDFYLCGPPPMTAAAQKLLMIEKQVSFDRIHFDRFF